ncbi:MAG: hypothetical protein KGJ80_14195, partial [Chloroflexota bacterium]|nr:hypothetical protein [Chloroflexota bacterium]
MKTLDGWIFDVYPTERDMAVWVIDPDSRAHFLRDTFAPAFFVGGDTRELRAVARFLIDQHWSVKLARVERTDLFLGHDIAVLQVAVTPPALFPTIFQRVARLKPDLTYYNCDVALPQMYFYARKTFPLAFCHLVVSDDNRIIELATDDSPWALDYPLPPLRRMALRLEGDALNPNHGYRAPIEIETEDETRTLNGDDPRELLQTLRGLLVQHDPDVIVTEWGDSFILPQLLKMARQFGIALPFNRDPTRLPQFRPAQSYFSYGRIVYKTSAQTLCGRWHIDTHNAFLTDDYGLEGAFEVARLTHIPVQRVVRTSTGTGISAMEIATAYRRDVLVPWHKQEPEAWKSALDLIQSDKGGLVYQPIIGLHAEVAEIDFVSMYPSIMARFNVSPETVGCACCGDHRVPEIGHSICARRRGLVPETIAPLSRKRIQYKARLREMDAQDPARELYRRRQSAHKWLLVTCFGYLGYKNARFGRIEAHESVTAYGRECLLRAKEITEAHGFRVLHGMVDSLWVQKRGATQDAYAALLAEITRATRLPIALEGIYRWVAFLPSRVDAQMSVANRYVGVFEDGEIKMRGIEARRRDTPPLLRAMQIEMLNLLTAARSREDYAARVPEVIEIACAYVDALRSGKVRHQDLVITKHISKDPAEYTRNNLTAIVAKELVGRGVSLSAGESIQYIITEQHAG